MHLEEARDSVLQTAGSNVKSRFDSLVADELFRLMVLSVQDYAIFLLDPTGHVASWNEGAQRIKGYTEQEIVGRHFSTFYPAEVAASGWPEHELRVAAAEGRFEDEGWRIRRDGSRFWANVVITAIRDASGALRGFAKVTRDLTERKFTEEALRQSEERYRVLIEGVRDYAIFMLDVNGHVVTWNSGAERLNGYTAGEIIGAHFSRFYPAEAIASGSPERELATARAEGRFEDDGWRVRKDGTTFWANVVLTAVYNRQGLLQGFSKITRDMTERRRLEEKTNQLNRELLKHVDELAAANRTLAAKSDENEAFVYSVSHDVRGPLVNIQGFSRELQQSCDDLAAAAAQDPPTAASRARVQQIVREDIAESLRFLQTSVEHLSNIVDGLLRLSRIGRIDYRIEEVDMAAAVRRVLDAARGVVEREHALVSLGPMPRAHADATAVEQIFSNLISNAVRYRHPDRPPRIEIGGEAQAGGQTAVYWVRDNGSGIPPSGMPKLFTAFRRFHPNAVAGEGIGLATVRRIVERLNGRVRAESTAGEGSAFYVELPVAPQAQS